MTKEEILNFATNTANNNQGLIYAYQVDNGKVHITGAGFVGDGTRENVCLHFQGDGSTATQTEIDTALNDYIKIHGRRPYHIGMIYGIEPNCKQDFASREEDVTD